ncbi:hypothetical protein UlMin_043850 [Ulmus minor]
MSEKITTQTQNSQWKLYVDGSSTETSSGAGIILVSPDGGKLKFQAKGEKMTSYLEKAKEAMNQFDTVTIIQVPRAENTNADKGFSSPSLLCLDEDRGKFTLEEVHAGVCGNHSSGRTLAHRILRQGYYWPTIQTDSLDFVRKCDKCQCFSTIPR